MEDETQNFGTEGLSWTNANRFRIEGGKCPHCEKFFNRRDNLRVHLRTHTGEKPYCCPLCSHRSALKCNLRTHVLNIHGSEQLHLYDKKQSIRY